ncbi:MAG: valine--pyruvate transaminase [Arenicella sp.]
MTNFSRFGQKFARHSGILQLMADLGQANHSKNPNICMLGGGNPAAIPAAEAIYQQEMHNMLSKPDSFNQMLGNYDGPQGSSAFINVLVELLNDRYDWGLTQENICLTNGSQTSFFNLFNLLAGEMLDGSNKQILLPLAPEYIGYFDQGLSDDMFIAQRPIIKHISDFQFKYHIDFDALEKQLMENPDIAAICASRPTNPTGNVLTDSEIARLDALAQKKRIPLIIDNAYGFPFPGAIYMDVNPQWHDNVILTMSLSKMGLPGARTGIVIANKKIISAMSSVNAVTALAPNSIGACLVTRLIQSGDAMDMRENIIRPFYQEKSQFAAQLAEQVFEGLPVKIHKPEGAFFLWAWCQDLPISTTELYQRLAKRDVYIIPSEYFFPKRETGWRHQTECLRITFTQPKDILERGLSIIAEELTRAYSEKQ